MPEQFLNASQVGPAFQKMRREAMTKRVRGYASTGGKIQPEPDYQALNITRTETDAVHADKDRPVTIRLRVSQSEAFPFVEIFSDRSSRKVPKWNNSLFSTLA